MKMKKKIESHYEFEVAIDRWRSKKEMEANKIRSYNWEIEKLEANKIFVFWD